MLSFREKMDKFNYIKIIDDRAECTIGGIYPIVDTRKGEYDSIVFMDDDSETDQLDDDHEKDTFIFVTDLFAQKHKDKVIDNSDEY